MRRSQVVALGVTAVLAGSSLTACGDDPDPEYAGMCVDQDTQVRLDDEQCRCVDPETNQWREDDDDCRQNRRHHGWYFIPFGFAAARVGSRVSGGGFTRPNTGYVAGGVNRSGGTISKSSVTGGTKVSRGGFGSKAGGSGG